MSKKIEIIEPCGECGSTNPHCCKEPFQLLEIYTEGMGNHLTVTSLGFYPTVEKARTHIEDFLRVEVLQDEEGTAKIEDEFRVARNRTIYINDDGSFEWHIIKVGEVQR